ncbi:MAG: peptide deformylase [Candidatus Nanopelagicales bacterium]|nr:peptide deformylase [Candidatus Nanopelagicales bacterium]
MDTDQLAGHGRCRPIVRWGNPVMHTACRPVTDFDATLAALVADMLATMDAAHGVGLAAPQIGVDLAVFVLDCPDADQHPYRGVVCNPVLDLPTGRERRLTEDDEGCLSLPGAYAPLARPDTAVCRGQGLDGNPIEISATGLLARCVQHETDHLQGIVLGDRLPTRTRRALYRDHDAAADQYPDDWPVTPRRAPS